MLLVNQFLLVARSYLLLYCNIEFKLITYKFLWKLTKNLLQSDIISQHDVKMYLKVRLSNVISRHVKYLKCLICSEGLSKSYETPIIRDMWVLRNVKVSNTAIVSYFLGKNFKPVFIEVVFTYV